MTVPSRDDLLNPTLQAFHNLGGSATTQELEEEVAKILGLSEDDINEIHKGSRTKLNYRLAWAKNYLKNYGLLENSQRGVWALTSKGSKTHSVEVRDVLKVIRGKKESTYNENETEDNSEKEEMERNSWKDELLELIKNLPPNSFEVLCKRLLRESGFTQVEVTGRGGDEGIDGKGILKIGGLLSFHVIFQCKRYSGSVSSPIVRNFRGAMEGRGDKGLIITTGFFTRDAKIEAQRDGAKPIDLIDGEELVEKMKELSLGLNVEVKQVEVININQEWFGSL